jgi:hypothetical protein
MHLLKKLLHSTEDRFLLITLLLFSLLRLPSFFEPNWYGDEGIYQVLGRAVRTGRVLYSGIWDNKPPLLYLTYALVDANQFWIRFLSYLAGFFAVVVFYMLCKKVFTSKHARFLSTGLFAFLFAIPTTEANIANAENFMLVFILCGGYLVFSSVTAQNRSRTLFLAGLLLSIAFLYKIVALFDYTAFFLFLTFIALPEKLATIKKRLRPLVKELLPFLAGFLLPIVLTTIIFFALGALTPFIKATFSNNVSYVGYKNFFLIPQGLLITKLLLLSCFTLILLKFRARLPQGILFALLWFGFALFDAFFSQRPYTHYVLMAIAPFSFLAGAVFTTKQYRLFTSLCLLAGASILIPTFEPVRIPKILAYYNNFIGYVSGKKTLDTYRSWFDADVPQDYILADFLTMQMKGRTERTIFLWGNTAQLYTLTNTLPPGRYTVAYHVGSREAIAETQNAIDQQKPRFVVLLRDSSLPPLLLTAYAYKATIGNAIIYERAF